MDPISLIVTALVTGAVAGIKPTAEQAIKDAYEGLKNLIQTRFSGVDVKPLEKNPESPAKQASIAEDLTSEKVDQDVDVLSSAQELIKLIESHAPETAVAAGITIEQLKSMGSVSIKDLLAAGAVQIRQIDAQEDIIVSGITAGQTSGPSTLTQQQGDSPKA